MSKLNYRASVPMLEWRLFLCLFIPFHLRFRHLLPVFQDDKAWGGIRRNGSKDSFPRRTRWRLDRAIPATGIIIRETFDCEARRCEGLSRQALTGGPRWWPPRRPRGCWRARRSPRGRSRPRRRRGGRARSGGLRRARSGRSRL